MSRGAGSWAVALESWRGRSYLFLATAGRGDGRAAGDGVFSAPGRQTMLYDADGATPLPSPDWPEGP